MTKPKPKAAPLEGQLFAPEPAAKPAQAPPRGGRRHPPKFETQVAQSQAVVPARKPPRPSLSATVADAGAAFLAMVREVALNPNIDEKKLEALLGMQERVMDRQARMAFDDALMRMQPKLPIITKDGRIVVKEKDARTGQRTGKETQNTPYAKWEKIAAVIKPILREFGFLITHRYSTAPDGRMRITAVLKGHGHTDDSCYMDLQADVTGSKNNAQGWASSGSYGKRHTACAVLNIITKDEDDDARSSGRPVTVGEPFTPEDAETIVALAIAAELPGNRLLKHMNEKRPKDHPEAQDIADLPRSRYQETLDAIAFWEQTRKERQGGNQKTQ